MQTLKPTNAPESPQSKRCTKCSKRKPITEFHSRMLRGKPYVTARCKVCVVADVVRYQATNAETVRATKTAWYADNSARIAKAKALYRYRQSRDRRAFVEAIKRNPCSDCGGTFDPACMDFDHLPKFRKGASIALMMSKRFTDDEVMDELLKCELVCSNCHRLRTSKRRTGA